GCRSVLHFPGAELDSGLNLRYSSAHSDTVSLGGGLQCTASERIVSKLGKGLVDAVPDGILGSLRVLWVCTSRLRSRYPEQNRPSPRRHTGNHVPHLIGRDQLTLELLYLKLQLS